MKNIDILIIQNVLRQISVYITFNITFRIVKFQTKIVLCYDISQVNTTNPVRDFVRTSVLALCT